MFSSVVDDVEEPISEVPVGALLRDTSLTALLTPGKTLFAVVAPSEPADALPPTDGKLLQISVEAHNFGMAGPIFFENKETSSRLLLEHAEQRERCETEEGAGRALLRMEAVFSFAHKTASAKVPSEDLLEMIEAMWLNKAQATVFAAESTARIAIQLEEAHLAIGYRGIWDDLQDSAMIETYERQLTESVVALQTNEQLERSTLSNSELSSRLEGERVFHSISKRLLLFENAQLRLVEEQTRYREHAERLELAQRDAFLHEYALLRLKCSEQHDRHLLGLSESVQRKGTEGALVIVVQEAAERKIAETDLGRLRSMRQRAARPPFGPAPAQRSPLTLPTFATEGYPRPKASGMDFGLPPLFCHSAAETADFMAIAQFVKPRPPRSPPTPLRPALLAGSFLPRPPSGSRNLGTVAGNAVNIRRAYDFTRTASSICPRPVPFTRSQPGNPAA
eukprot:TRINITY_DN55594_c0_g1_i1.p1 TRINITY_DN55594_c0_g1~~TRINITY_DN55594_c0_g1_i1.p1  ORF type:complete len:451 (-),score=37.86 TRINITY_DN55594_c0_g1_i1:49-1401(-)